MPPAAGRGVGIPEGARLKAMAAPSLPALSGR